MIIMIMMIILMLIIMMMMIIIDDDDKNLFAAGVLAADLGSIVVPLDDRIRSVFRIVSRKT